MDWEPLAAADPLPGEPGAVAAAAATLHLTAGDLAAHSLTVAGIDPGTAFVGYAAERFDAIRGRSAEQLARVGDRTAEVAGALLYWSAALSAAQQAGAAALELAQRADDDRATARAGIRERESFEAAAEGRARMLGALIPAVGPEPEPWPGPDWDAALAAAEADLATADALLADAVGGRDRDAATAVAALDEATGDGLADTPLMTLVPWMGPTGGLGWLARRRPTVQFLRRDGRLVLNTEPSWRHESYAEAGIDADHWLPARGLEANDATVRAAWEYYRTLHDADPDHFQWAGLAWFAGATVYAGVQDLSVTTDHLRRVGAAGDVVEELDEIEGELLGMQKHIFDDIAWQHVAYRDGGLAAMQGLYGRGQLTRKKLRVWEKVDAGDEASVTDANRALAHIEQHDVIGGDFTRLREGHGVVGRAFTLATSLAAASPVPGGRPFRDVVHREVEAQLDTPDRVPLVPDGLVPDKALGVDVPGGDGLYVDTPDRLHVDVELPVDDLSVFHNRWRWITDDMLPAYRRFVARGGWDDYADVSLAELARSRRVVPDPAAPYRP